jgi:hypothetical protein
LSTFGAGTFGSGTFGDPVGEIEPEVPSVVIPEFTPPLTTFEWKIILKGATSQARIGELAPNNLEFNLNHDRPGSIGWKLPKGHDMARKEFSEPYATDFELWLNDHWIMEGIVTAADAGETTSETVDYIGQDYLHYLEGRIFPFDPTDLSAHEFVMFEEDVFFIIEEMLDHVLAQPNSLNLTYNNGISNIIGNLAISPGDTENILAKITNLSEQKPGFDFETRPGKVFKMYTPSKPKISAIRLEEGKNLIKLGYKETGIGGTWVLGLASGGSSRLGVVKENLEMQAKYRRLDHTADFGGATDEETLGKLTDGELDRAMTQKLELVAHVIVETSDFFRLLESGMSVFVKGETFYESVEDYFKITSIRCTVADNGYVSAEVILDDNTIQV